MASFFIIYLLMILENIQSYLKVIAVVAAVSVFVIVFFRGISSIDNRDNPDYKIFNNHVKWLIGICLVTSLFANLIPSKQDMAIIAAGGITYNVLTSDKAAELGAKSVELMNKKLEQLINDPLKATKDAKAIVDEVTNKEEAKQ